MFVFFPIFKEQVENELFRKLSPTEKLQYWLLSSEYCRYSVTGKVGKADSWYAAALDISLNRVRIARRKFAALGWIDITPGYQTGRINIATQYKSVKWCNVAGTTERFADMSSYVLLTMLEQVIRKKLKHTDVLVYVYLYYWLCMQRKAENEFADPDDFFISKRQLIELTGVSSALNNVANLYDKFQFSGGEKLFEYVDTYHKLQFKEWNYFTEPAEDKEAAENDKNRRHIISVIAKIMTGKNTPI